MAPVDRVADWLVHELDARAQLRFGVVVVFVAVVWAALALLFSGEPPNVVAMSGVALVLAGVGIVLAAEILETGEDTEVAVDQKCARCSSALEE